MGRWLRHAYYPNWNLRLFRHSLGRYEKLTDAATASGDNEVHEHVVVQGPTGRLALRDGSLRLSLGRSVSSRSTIVIPTGKRGSPSPNGAAGSSGQLQSTAVARRRRFKQLSQRLPFRPLLRFLYVYFWQKGFLDGREGYYFARLHGFYEFLSVAKTYELKKPRRSA